MAYNRSQTEFSVGVTCSNANLWRQIEAAKNTYDQADALTMLTDCSSFFYFKNNKKKTKVI